MYSTFHSLRAAALTLSLRQHPACMQLECQHVLEKKQKSPGKKGNLVLNHSRECTIIKLTFALCVPFCPATTTRVFWSLCIGLGIEWNLVGLTGDLFPVNVHILCSGAPSTCYVCRCQRVHSKGMHVYTLLKSWASSCGGSFLVRSRAGSRIITVEKLRKRSWRCFCEICGICYTLRLSLWLWLKTVILKDNNVVFGVVYDFDLLRKTLMCKIRVQKYFWLFHFKIRFALKNHNVAQIGFLHANP